MQNKRRTIYAAVLWILAAAWLAVLFLLSRQNAAESGALSMGLTGFILRVFPWLEMSAARLEIILRKLAHGAGFAIEGLLLCLAAGMRFGPRPGAALSAGLCALMAVLTELVQTLADGRSCEIRDMLIDFGGAVTGILFALLLLHLLRRRPRE